MRRKLISFALVIILAVICLPRPRAQAAAAATVGASVILGLIIGEVTSQQTSEVVGGLIERGGAGVDFLFNKDNVMADWVRDNFFKDYEDLIDREKNALKLTLTEFDMLQSHVLALFGATPANGYTAWYNDYNFAYILSPGLMIDINFVANPDLLGKWLVPVCVRDGDIYLLKSISMSAKYISQFRFGNGAFGNPVRGGNMYFSGFYDAHANANTNFGVFFRDGYFWAYNEVSRTAQNALKMAAPDSLVFVNAAGDTIPYSSSNTFLYLISDDQLNYDAIHGMTMTNSAITAHKDEVRDILDPVIDLPGITADDIILTIPLDDTLTTADVIVDAPGISTTLEAIMDGKPDLDLDFDTPDTIIDKFPFSLPFDFHRVLSIFVAEPQAPKFEVPFEMEGFFDYTITIDLADFEWLAEIVRWLFWAVFVVGLIFATRKLIWR